VLHANHERQSLHQTILAPCSSRMRSTRLSESHSGCNTVRPHARDSGSLPVADALEAIRQIAFACIDPETLVGSLIDELSEGPDL
jgi:hypothetical protein